MQQRFETFTVLINRISRNIRKIKNQEMAQYNLRSAHISCLYYLYSNQGSTATELCERCEEDKATISRALEFLIENGFVDSQLNSGRKYKKPILLTEKGKEAGKKIFDKVNCVLSEVGNGLNDEERSDLYKHLTVISDNLEKVTNSLA